MHDKYDHKAVEEKWLKVWEKEGLFQDTVGEGVIGRRGPHFASATSDSRRISSVSGSEVSRSDLVDDMSVSAASKMYLLFAFAYPSGEGLHVGHVESKTALDILARYYRMKGKQVFFPVGWDAFGLPAENYAIKTGVPPAVTTKKAIDTFRRQIKRLGISYDWEAEVATSHPEYYKWTQWLFLQLYKRGKAYKALGRVNWCPSCKTVLANEQVVQKTQNSELKIQNYNSKVKIEEGQTVGVCERCEAEVEKKEMEQWYFKITDYADELISGLDRVDWPEPTKQQQLNWIGKSEGLREKWQVKDMDLKLETFTTWPHTSWGAKFMVVAPEHPVIEKLVKGTEYQEGAKEFVRRVEKQKLIDRMSANREKEGYFTGRYVVNHLTGWEMPVYIANFAIKDYGTGIVKCTPAHDERDFAFARKYKLPIRKVIDFDSETHVLLIKKSLDDEFIEEVEDKGWYWMEYDDWGYGVVVPSGEENGLVEMVQKRMKHGAWYAHTDGRLKVVIYKDKVFGADERDKAREYGRSVGVAEEDLDWDNKDKYKFCYIGEGKMVNAGEFTGNETDRARKSIADYTISKGNGEYETNYKLRDWLISRQRYWGVPIPIVYDPEGKPHVVKEEHLPWMLPTDVEFKPTGESPLVNSKELRERTERLYGKGWKPEVDTMDTFVCSSWYYMRYTDARNKDAFARNERLKEWLPVDFYMIGPEHIVLHLLYSRFLTKFLRDEGHLGFDEPFVKMRHQGMILGPDHRKMSKSKGNVINPDEIVEKYGADTLRMYEMFLGPLEADKPWDPRAVVGLRRFLDRVWRLVIRNEGILRQFDSLHKSRSVQDDSAELNSISAESSRKKLVRRLHLLIEKVGEDVPALKFNTAIAAMMEFVNSWEEILRQSGNSHISRVAQDDTGGSKSLPSVSAGALYLDEVGMFVRVLAPFAPFMTEELWHIIQESGVINRELNNNQQMGESDDNEKKLVEKVSVSVVPDVGENGYINQNSVHRQSWPEVDKSLVAQRKVVIVIQVNGKRRGEMRIDTGEVKEDMVVKRVQEIEEVKKWLEGKEVKKVVWVEPKEKKQGLVNFVVGSWV